MLRKTTRFRRSKLVKMTTPGDDGRSLISLVQGYGEEIPLAESALLIAKVVDDSICIRSELESLDSLFAMAPTIAQQESPLASANQLSEFLFDQQGFTGNHDNYYDPKNSLLNHVMRRKLGIPITLSLLLIEAGRRCGVPLIGVGMPGHFLVRHIADGSCYIDPFNRGLLISQEECAEQFHKISPTVRWNPNFLQTVTNKAIITRILRNLAAIWSNSDEATLAIQMLNLLVQLEPQVPGHLRDRGMLKYRTGDKANAETDLESYLQLAQDAPDIWYVRRLLGHK